MSYRLKPTTRINQIIICLYAWLSLTSFTSANPAEDRLKINLDRMFGDGQALYVADATFSTAAVIWLIDSNTPQVFIVPNHGSSGSEIELDLSPSIVNALSKVTPPSYPRIDRLRLSFGAEAQNIAKECLTAYSHLVAENANASMGVAVIWANGTSSTLVYGFTPSDRQARLWMQPRQSSLPCQVSPRITESSPLASVVETLLTNTSMRLTSARVLSIGDRGIALAGPTTEISVRINDEKLAKLIAGVPDSDGFKRFSSTKLMERAVFDATVNGSGTPDPAISTDVLAEICHAIVQAQPDATAYRRRDPLLWLLVP